MRTSREGPRRQPPVPEWQTGNAGSFWLFPERMDAVEHPLDQDVAVNSRGMPPEEGAEEDLMGLVAGSG